MEMYCTLRPLPGVKSLSAAPLTLFVFIKLGSAETDKERWKPGNQIASTAAKDWVYPRRV
jgi:hypothetical protein